MKKCSSILAALCALMFSATVLAQEFTMKWGAPFAARELGRGYRVLSISAEGLVVLTHAGFGPVVQPTVVRFDASLNLKETKKIKFKLGEKNLHFETIMNLKNRILVFSTLDDAKTKKKTLYYQVFDPRSLDMAGEPVSITEMSFDPKPFAKNGSFDYRISPDSGMAAIVYNPPSGLKSAEKFEIIVMDDKLAVVYKKAAELSFRDNAFTVKSIRVSNEGDVFFSGILSTGPYNPMKRDPNYKYTVAMVTQADEKPTELNVEFGDQFISDMQIGLTHEGNLVAAGFYSDRGGDRAKGCFSIIIDPITGNAIHKSKMDFPLELFTEGLTDKQAAKVTSKTAKGKEYEFLNVNLDELVLRPDNGMVLVAEQFYSTTTYYTTSSGSTSSKTTYHANSLILAGISSEGEIEFTKKLLKQQSSSSSAIISYVMVTYENKMYFMFADHALNLASNPKKTEYADFGKKGVASLVTLDLSTGDMSRKKLYGYDKYYSYIYPGLSLSLDDGTAILATWRGNKIRLCLVTFD